jgi:hypothetical protein
VLSTDPTFITFLKLRLEFVATGSFDPAELGLADPLASLG